MNSACAQERQFPTQDWNLLQQTAKPGSGGEADGVGKPSRERPAGAQYLMQRRAARAAGSQNSPVIDGADFRNTGKQNPGVADGIGFMQRRIINHYR